ncbi:MAG: protease inhibitor I42 family protein [Chloroflexota bacterium]
MPDLQITFADDGATVTLAPGDRLICTLPELATAGYRWELDVELDPNVAQIESNQPIPPFTGAVGAAGAREIVVLAVGPGRIPLRYKRWQPWGGPSSVDSRFGMTLDVTS